MRVALLLAGGIVWLVPPAAADTRYHQSCARAKGSGGAVKAVAATHFGGPGAEEFIAVGNAWGPEFAAGARPTMIGEDRYAEAEALTDPEKLRLNYQNPNIAAFVVTLSPALDRIVRVTRFGWGNAMAGKALIAADGAVLLSGRCQPAFRQFLQGQALRHTMQSPEGANWTGADLYLARLAPDGKALEWAIVFVGAEGWSAQWEGRLGDKDHVGIRTAQRSDGSLVLVAFDRLYALTEDGKTLTEIGPTRGGNLLAVDPRDDGVYLGADENTNTGREPWRRARMASRRPE